MGGQNIQEAVAEYQACVAAAQEVYNLAVAEAEKSLRAAMGAPPSASGEETVTVTKDHLKKLETVAAVVAKNPELFSVAKV